jgi:DNA-binding GntR family transcriptional regulator
MSLYQTSKLLYVLNRDAVAKARFRDDPEGLVDNFDLSEEERKAVLEHDIGLLYVLGVNGQFLMHFAALCGVAWADYLQMMRDGVTRYGPVRAGIYAMTTFTDEKVAGV